MPRDNKGNVFGHGSVMQDAHGHKITVEGFATQAHGRIDVAAFQAIVGPKYKVYRWTDLHNVNEKEKSHAALDTTDHCNVDRAQVAVGTPVTMMAADDGDKVIWGS